MDNTSQSYYLDRKKEILAEADQFLLRIQQDGEKTYSQSALGQIQEEAKKRFEALLPDLPYIGGDTNFLTKNLITGAITLCVYKAMKARGSSLEEIGRLIFDTVASFSDGEGKVDPPSEAEVEEIIALRKQAAEFSQKYPYPYGWQTTFIEGDCNTFDWGVDYTTCGIWKLFSEHGAAEFVPYLCFLDLVTYRGRGIGLVRTKTLARGGKMCDFRFNLRSEYALEWTPDFYQRLGHSPLE